MIWDPSHKFPRIRILYFGGFRYPPSRNLYSDDSTTTKTKNIMLNDDSWHFDIRQCLRNNYSLWFVPFFTFSLIIGACCRRRNWKHTLLWGCWETFLKHASAWGWRALASGETCSNSGVAFFHFWCNLSSELHSKVGGAWLYLTNHNAGQASSGQPASEQVILGWNDIHDGRKQQGDEAAGRGTV